MIIKQLPIIAAMLIVSIALTTSCQSNKVKQQVNNPTDTITTNINGKGVELILHFERGKAHNHPTMAVWIEDMDENYIQTLFVTKALATGTFSHGAKTDTSWLSVAGAARRPATLPYWLHKRNIKASDNTYLPTPEQPVADAYTGATPSANFALNTRSDGETPTKFRLLLEINQPWDWNNYWNNSKYPDDVNYKTSSQPSLVYAVTVTLDGEYKKFYLNPIGHGHYAGHDGLLYTDLRTMTTALNIVERLWVEVK